MSTVQTIATDARAMLAAAETDWDRPVPHCPEWDAAELIRHTGGILMWMAAVVSSGQRVSRRTLEPAPADPGDLPSWFLENLDHTVMVLDTADSESQTWTFSRCGDHRAGWWRRRLAVEVAIHRWDAQHAAALDGGSSPQPIDSDVAAAGVAEFIIEFLPGLLSQESVEGLLGTLHLHATDEPMEWFIDLDDHGAAVATHLKADTAIRGTRSDLLLWLTNRDSLHHLEIFGQADIVHHWRQLQL